MPAVRNSKAGFVEAEDLHAYRIDGWPTTSTLPGLLDTRVVRAELARLRRPRVGVPATERFALRSSTLTRQDLNRP
jgi:hypothetical protein